MAWTSQPTKQLTHDDYTVAWICALPIEKTAARNMLDELHRPPPQPEHDNNLYTLGSTCGHNVVIVCQGDMGTTAAAMVATQMVATFRKLRFGLLVGIAGGVPDMEDIRLGDVVVSKGVVTHDRGKETPGGFESRPFLNGVPELLKNAFSELESLLMDRESKITQYISNAIAKNPCFSAFARPTLLLDNLFDKEYIHFNPGDKTCSECDKSRLILRESRHGPKLHFGIVASGNQVIKNGIKRGRILEAHPGVMAIEMEAAGLMNVFGCATIRGICDYADSHKNDGWHKYASAAAAAVAKEILSIIPTRAATPAISMTEHILPPSIELISPLILSNTTKRPEWRMVLSKTNASVDDIFERISAYDYLRAYTMRKGRRLKNTTNWILKHPDFLAWLNGEGNSCMWLSGIVGCGKSITMTTVIEATIARAQSNSIPVLHFIYDHSYQRYLTALALFESYIKQLFMYLEQNNKSCPPAVIVRLLEFYGSGKRPPDVQELISEILIPLYYIVGGSGVTFLVDGVDECSRKEILEVLNGLRQLLRLRSCKVFICCREEVSILRGILNTNHIRITAKHTKADLEVFVDDEIERIQCGSFLSSNEAVLNSIRYEILKRADGMFLWVKYLIKMIWEDCTGEQSSDEAIYETLKRLPKDLNETYQRCLERVNPDDKRKLLADRILRWICVSPEPFKIIQLQEALALNLDTGKLERGLIPKEEIVACCASLASLEEEDSDELILLAHHSVRPFVFPSGAESAYKTAQVELGELCVNYLFNYRPVKEPPHHGASSSRHIGTTLPTPINSILIPRTIMYFLSPRQNRVSVQLPKPVPRNITVAGTGFPSYAKNQWMVLTSNILNTSLCWSKFRNLALPDDRSWDIFPWQSCLSLSSHVFELYRWSIIHSHYSLLSLAISQQGIVNNEIFDLPFFDQVGQQAVLPLQAVAATGDPRILELVLKIVSKPNEQYDKVLYIASSKGHLEVIQFLHKAGVNINARRKGPESIFQTAFHNGHRQVVQYLIHAGANRNVHTLQGHTGPVRCVAFSPDGQLVASASNDNTVRLWDAKTGVVHQTLQGHLDWVRSVAFSPDGQQVASASDDATVRLWDAKTGAAHQTLRDHERWVRSVVFSPDGQLVASASGDAIVRLWDAKTGATHQTLQGHKTAVAAVAFSPDGQLVASASDDRTVRLWDAKTGAAHQTLQGHKEAVAAVAFSPDGQLVASASNDNTVRLWDAKTGVVHQMLQGHVYWVLSVVFSPEGQLVASASYDKTVRLWDAKTGATLQTLKGHTDSVWSVAFSPDGQLVASASNDGSVKLWVSY